MIKYHFSNCTIKSISSFLTSRKQRVVVNRVCSSWWKVLSGVPQGSVLGPVLFHIFINDLLNDVESFVKLIADYTKLYFTANSPTDCSLIQHDLDQMHKWSDCWFAKKCKVIHYGNSNPYNQYTFKELDGSTLILKEVRNECDLGITFDSKLSLKEHIAHIVNKANSIISLIKRSFKYMGDKCSYIAIKPWLDLL